MTLNVRNINQEKILKILGEPSDNSSSDSVIGILKRLHNSSSVNGETISDIIDEIDDLKITKADKNNTYTKAEIDEELSLKADESDVNIALNLKADKSDTYTKSQIDDVLATKANQTSVNNALNLKADKSNVYTISETNNALNLKANQSDVTQALNLKADKSTTYTKTEVNNNLALKADKSNTYTKTEVDNLITNSEITNYVTTDTTQSITGTKLCNELHADSFYTESILLKNHTFNGSLFKENYNGDTNYKLCSKAYIDDLIVEKIPLNIDLIHKNYYENGSFRVHVKINNADKWIETYGAANISYGYLGKRRLFITFLRLNIQTTTDSTIDLIEIITPSFSGSDSYSYRALNPTIKQGSGGGICGRNWQLTSCSSIFTLGYAGDDCNYSRFIFWENPTTKTYKFSTAYWSFFLNGCMFDLYDNIENKYVYE